MADRKSTDFIIVHCSATRATHDVDIADVDRWHRAQNWRMVGYHFFIKRNGTIQTGRPVMEAGAHARDYNNKSIGICMAGGVAKDGKTPASEYTPAQWKSLQKIVLTLHARFPQARIIGHCDVAPKACPCFDVKKWWAENKPT